MSSPTFVRCRDCTCPDSPHEEGDGVYLSPSLSLEGGLTAEQQMLEVFDAIPLPAKPSPEVAERVGRERSLRLRPLWYSTFLRYGAVGWNLPEPFDIDALLADYSLARPAADAAADLYQSAVLAPFQSPSPATSPTGPTASSTSPTPLSSRSRRKPR